MKHLSLWELCYGNLEVYKRVLEMGTSFHGGLTGKPGRGFMPGAYVWKKVLERVSLHIGTPLGGPGSGVRLPGTLKIS
jgi:hypothetical protein